MVVLPTKYSRALESSLIGLIAIKYSEFSQRVACKHVFDNNKSRLGVRANELGFVWSQTYLIFALANKESRLLMHLIMEESCRKKISFCFWRTLLAWQGNDGILVYIFRSRCQSKIKIYLCVQLIIPLSAQRHKVSAITGKTDSVPISEPKAELTWSPGISVVASIGFEVSWWL